MNKNIFNHLIPLIFILYLGTSTNISWSSSSINQAKENLNHLEKKISAIKSNINQDMNEHKELKSKIKNTITKINKTQQQKQELTHKIQLLSSQISQLNQNIILIQNNMYSFQKILYQHLNLHLHLTQEPYWEIVFGAENPFEYYQRIELAQYLHHSEQLKILDLTNSKKILKHQEIIFQENQHALFGLEKKLTQQELTFQNENKLHQKELNIIKQSILEKTQELHLVEKNQENLKKLIQGLLKQNTLQSRKPFSVMKQQLNLPIHESNPSAYEQAHGLLFATAQNTPVHAVSSGKVVFSDWLNGYGYLIILDHGWGFMTLYGNNNALVKHKGEFVHQGDIIAKVGQSGSFKKTGLYFEIRQRAKVVSARAWFKTHLT
jgi:hypothetical protein